MVAFFLELIFSQLEDKSPCEALIGKKPSLSHIRVFGCDAYVHVPMEKITKLDSKSERCIFIGYKDGLKGYKNWNHKQGRLCTVEMWCLDR